MSARIPDCTLFLPALFGASPAVATPVLETLLARAHPLPPLAPGFDRALFDLFQLPTGRRPPIAAVARLGEDPTPEPAVAWMRADPVFLQLDGTRLRLLGSTPLHLTAREAHALVAELAPLFADIPARLEAPHPERWYLALPTEPRLDTETLAEVLGGDVDTHLPQGEDARLWRRRLNEAQMLLHGSPVNAERETRGALPVNSLWFWGAGKRPIGEQSSWLRVWSDEPVARGLARLTSTPISPLTRTGGDWLSEAEEAGEHLVVLGDGLEGVLDVAEPRMRDERLARIEQEWMQPLAEALRMGDIGALTIVSDAGKGFRLRGGDLRRWWRRRRGLAAYSV